MKKLILGFAILTSCMPQRPVTTAEEGTNYDVSAGLSTSTQPTVGTDTSMFMLQASSLRPQKADYTITLSTQQMLIKVTFALLSQPQENTTYYIQTDPVSRYFVGGNDPNYQYSAQRLQLLMTAEYQGRKATQVTGSYKVVKAGQAPGQEVSVEIDLTIDGQRVAGPAAGVFAAAATNRTGAQGTIVLKSGATYKSISSTKTSGSTGSSGSGQQQSSGNTFSNGATGSGSSGSSVNQNGLYQGGQQQPSGGYYDNQSSGFGGGGFQ